ncbi:hypothetical protein FKP32DRAFT_1682481 [Trametes sanguinea]|nr:hypothetical protein FKP32DRAFT_1682481 [Trametes sanguinea]
MKLPHTPPAKLHYAFLPNGLEHPKFRRYEGGHSAYILCHKATIQHVKDRGTYKRFSPDGGTTTMHPLVAQQIGHILRVRVLQELQLLARRLLRIRRSAEPGEPPLLRRLTRGEWSKIKATGVIPFKNAVAVLVVPPLNKDPQTKMHPTPATTSAPITEDVELKDLPRSLPISVLHPTSDEERLWKDHPLSKLTPPSLVPLYNGVSLFPSRTQRAALHAAISKVLKAERTTRLMTSSQLALSEEATSTSGGPKRAKGDKKASHAVLVCSDERTILRADTAPLAIALWRVRMWEGGLDEAATVDWMADPPRTA